MPSSQPGDGEFHRIRASRSLAELGLSGEVSDVVAGVDLAWAAIRGPAGTSSRFVKLTHTKLAVVSGTDIFGIPVAMDGGRLLPSDFLASTGGSPPASIDFVVVASRSPSVGEQSRILAFKSGNPLIAPITNRFDGTPVAVRVTACTKSEFAYVATRNPNRIYKFDVAKVQPRPATDLDDRASRDRLPDAPWAVHRQPKRWRARGG